MATTALTPQELQAQAIQQAGALLKAESDKAKKLRLKERKAQVCRERGDCQRNGKRTTLIIIAIIVGLFAFSPRDNFSLKNSDLSNFKNDLSNDLVVTAGK